MSSLLLIDGHAVMYRAFYAIKELTTADGHPTNAVYGFIRMLGQMQRVWNPTHWAVIFDGGLPEERMEILPTYKAQRDPMPDSLRQQFDLIDEYLALSEIPSICIENEEADDVMASLADRAQQAGYLVFLATSDKDLFQAVNEKIFMVPPSKSDARIGVDEIIGKTGVGPEKIVEWLSLTGDASDNIPGVPGVGSKTASKLLNQFGSLDQLWKQLENVSSEKLKEALEEHKDSVIRNIQIITLRKEIDCPIDWNDLTVRDPKSDQLLPFFKRLEFDGLARALKTN
ncbi:MAG: hypothetical protein GKR87_14990 [Kiritimatiellae bacterium]|nr:hypothetical protein [Kiritimatiellia bacterium]